MESGNPRRAELLVDLAEALAEAGQIDRANEALGEAAATAEVLHDDRLGAHVVAGKWFVKASAGSGDIDQAEEEGLDAVAVFRRHADDLGLARAWYAVGSSRWWTGRGASAEEALELSRRHARAAGNPRKEADGLLIWSAVLVQGPEPAEKAARRAERILEENPGHRTIESYMSHALAHLRAWQGRFDEARASAHRYRDILRENGQEANWADSSECAADVELLAGDLTTAVDLLVEGQRRFDEMGVTDATILPFLAYALYAAGRWQEAEDPAVRAIHRGHQLWKMMSQTVLARVRARQGRGEEAETLAQKAVAASTATDYLVFQGRTALGIAEVLELLHRRDEARAHRVQAIEAFERKGAVVWADLARAGSTL
jgi:tetratricopeptide (TPR) repeat protein